MVPSSLVKASGSAQWLADFGFCEQMRPPCDADVSSNGDEAAPPERDVTMLKTLSLPPEPIAAVPRPPPVQDVQIYDGLENQEPEGSLQSGDGEGLAPSNICSLSVQVCFTQCLLSC